jgi:hypothetical protein
MHAELDQMLPVYLRHTPDALLKVSNELQKFAGVQNYWWPKVVNLPTQADRLEELKKVVELLQKKDFDLAAFEKEYEMYYSEEYDEGVFRILRRGYFV